LITWQWTQLLSGSTAIEPSVNQHTGHAVADDPNDMQGLTKALTKEAAQLTSDQVYTALPRLGRELIEVIGFEAAMTLIEKRGGQRITVPGWPLKRLSARFAALAEIIGEEAATKYADRWGNSEIQVPRGVELDKLRRNLALIAEYEAGVRVPDLAARYKLTESTVWKWLKKPV
jgi:hypothetical protein